MVRKIFAFMVVLWITGCNAGEPLPPAEAQEILRNLWHTDRRQIWEIDWPALPVGGPLVVETWRLGARYRYEILEATAPALVGETLVYDGRSAWPYNRFDLPPTFETGLPYLAPVTETFTQIERLLAAPAVEARQSPARINFQPTRLITLTYSNGDTLSVWWNETVALPVKVVFEVEGQMGELLAREVEPLGDAPVALFKVGQWLSGPP